MTSQEAFRAIGEVMHGNLDFKEQRHLEELSDRIMDKEVPFEEADLEIDKRWEEENRD
jgi:hypothetical protein